jgi:hypothetical protein
MSNNPFFTNTSFDFYEKGKDDVTPMVLRSKEESAPSNVFANLVYLSKSAQLDTEFEYK